MGQIGKGRRIGAVVRGRIIDKPARLAVGAVFRREERIEAAVRAVVHTLATDPADARLYMECPGFPRLRARQLRAVREFSELMAAQAVSFTGRPERSVDRVLATQLLVAGTTDLIIAWLHGDIDTDEKTLIATVTATALVGVAGL